ncbi:MAG: hypothetical protein ABIK12_09510 [Pseudomonadota bacterium]
MNRGRMWAGLLAVFACGLIIGALSGSLYERNQAAERYNQIRRDKGAFLTALVLERLQETLALSPQQRAGIQPLLMEGFRRSLQVREEVRPRQDKIMRETTEQIRGLLTPKQAGKLGESGEWMVLKPWRRTNKP